MFDKNNTESYLESLQRRMNALNEAQSPTVNQNQQLFEMQRLVDFQHQHPNEAMWEWVEQQPAFQQSASRIKGIFFDWIYTQYQSGFLQWVQENKLPIINEHVDLAISTSQEYVSPDKKFEQREAQMQSEIDLLKQTVQQLINKNKGEGEVQKF